ncbi:hypothetical protein WJX72_011900 [[Myrmecia] bisecta]|uniref:Protein kinase domain-containing protein n=1 Tax=[Myrmecia] bisecta TaxID=41462 RepID=A0AAW1Q8Z3_9CHLO
MAAYQCPEARLASARLETTADRLLGAHWPVRRAWLSMPLVNIKPGDERAPREPTSDWKRTLEFWTRASGIYLAYKATQLRAANLRLLGWEDNMIEAKIWTPHHEWTGDQMYNLCVDLRGFYLKVGQFLGARGDFVPMPICQRLCKLHDQVPPMSPEQTRAVIEAELAGRPMGEVFEWINAQPLGAASISQVHKAQLHKAARPPGTPRSGIVAVKVQYPNALPIMLRDLSNIRPAASFLQKTELAFDLVSVVDELAKQITLEFDFRREARVMDTVNEQLQSLRGTVMVPRSIPGLVTERLLVMTYLDGEQITRMQENAYELTRKQKRAMARVLLTRISEAYGRMLLFSGLFQADCHPGNILVMKRGKIGLIDYGQSKQLSEEARLNFAKLIMAMADGSEQQVSQAVSELGIQTAAGTDALRSEMAFGMFDTRGRVDPFDANSPLKKMAIEKFPGDFFFVLRVVQLLRGLANKMDIEDFSCVAHCLAAATTLAWHSTHAVSPLLAAASLLAVQIPAAPLLVRRPLPLLALCHSMVALIASASVTAMLHKIRPLAGYLMLPYLAWQTFTAVLSFSIWRLDLEYPAAGMRPVTVTQSADSEAESSANATAAVHPALCGSAAHSGLQPVAVEAAFATEIGN